MYITTPKAIPRIIVAGIIFSASSLPVFGNIEPIIVSSFWLLLLFILSCILFAVLLLTLLVIVLFSIFPDVFVFPIVTSAFFCVLYSSRSVFVLGISNKDPSIAHTWYPFNHYIRLIHS